MVAEEISPSDTISLPPEMILGIATERGSTTSHASLLARALGMPAVVGVKGLIKSVADGDIIMLDGSIGTITLNPDARSCAEVKKMMRGHLTDGDDAAHKTPGAMRDGHAVPLLANVDSSTPLVRLHASGAEGIGLYRTEYLWFKGNREPDEAEQTHAYTEIAKAMSNNGTVTIRVLDVGGDKTLTGDAAPHHEANPFLGNRSIRYLLNNVEVFRRQLRAILRASAHGRVRIMYPMIATIEELRAANAELRVCMEQMRAEGVAFDAAIQCGVMIEIPAAALIAEALANECDFFSIGTNDLIQYTLAVDRGNASVAQLYQPAHHAVLRLIEMSVKAAHERGLKVSVCGEMAADPAMAVLLVGLGVDALSMSPNLIGGVREVLSCVTLGEAIDLAGAVMALLDATGGAGYEYCTATVGALRARIVSGG